MTTLKQAILNHRVAHAYLFYGSDLETQIDCASWMARALQCLYFTENGPCNTCSACQKISKKIHPDVQFWVPQGALRVIRIEDVKQLQKEASYKPFEGRVKVQVIQESDRLHPTAANALLKILEEPPDKTFFILLTEELEDVLPTLQSRCQGVRMEGVKGNFPREMLQGCDGDEGLFEVLREFSKSNPEKALSLVEQEKWKGLKLLIQSLKHAMEGSWITLFAQVEEMVHRIEDGLEAIETKWDEEKIETDDSSLKKKLEEEKKTFLAGEKTRSIKEMLRFILVWARVYLEKKKNLVLFPEWVKAVEEARLLLERGANLKWVLEAMIIKLKKG
ncbi:MAG: DNA polymerase III subunit [Chlamydiae bacterium]|nr:DNA polymerase III subunit [Chlamydiota bacterium]MBI3276792.1 DNA polymerase III subunit [Chlamydiota bacterium]